MEQIERHTAQLTAAEPEHADARPAGDGDGDTNNNDNDDLSGDDLGDPDDD